MTEELLSNRSMPRSTVIPELAYMDVAKAVEWLCTAFGFTERLRIGNHRAQLTFEQGSIIVTQRDPGQEIVSHSKLSSDSQARVPLDHSVIVRVIDIDRHFERAAQYGARILHPPADYPYGERQYTAEDPEGHIWTFSQTIEDVDPASWGGRLSDQA